MANQTSFNQSKRIVMVAVNLLSGQIGRVMARESFDTEMGLLLPTYDVDDIKNIINDRAGIDNSGEVTKMLGAKEFHFDGDPELIATQTIKLITTSVNFVGTSAYNEFA
jgi:hypothetical protein